MNLAFLAYDIRRHLREVSGFFFAIGLPILMFTLFGIIPDYATETLPGWNGNVCAITMASMALYGAMTFGGTLSAQSASEYAQGWGRQLALTPMTATQFVVTKTVAIQLLAALPVIGVYAVGALTKAEITGAGWLVSGLLAWITVLPVSILGLGLGLILRSSAAERIVGAALVLCAFLGNLFMPLSDSMLQFARFTPLYAANVLTRYPINGGETFNTAGQPNNLQESWQLGLLNFAVWTLIMALFAIYAARRPQEK